MKEQQLIQQFRDTVYQSFEKRGDAALDLIDALTGSMYVESPVGMSESPLFRRQYSSVYDVLTEGEIKPEVLRKLWYTYQPATCEKRAGYEVYGLDATPNPRPEAPTLVDAQYLKASKHAAVQVGYKYSWLARLVEWGTSWVVPQSIERIASTETDSQCGAAQVRALAQQSTQPKIVVGDSLYSNSKFLAVFVALSQTAALVRLRHNRRLYEAPPPRQPGQRGRPRKHGAKFKVAAPEREPEQDFCFRLGHERVHIQVWSGLHMARLSELVGSVLRITFLTPTGKPRYQRSLYLFWTGDPTVSATDLCTIYLWRFAIEHTFRFLKQHLGLNANQSTDLHSTTLWLSCCGLAYYQLLLLRSVVADQRPAWHPTHRHGHPLPLTPRQVQRQALSFLLQLGTPARPPKRVGKGRGRALGYQPPPRQRYSVKRKTKKRPHIPAAA